jgi:hypothetical protein
MPKESFYFSHDYNARNDDKILELRSEYGAEGYGIFWMIIETMAENEDGGVKATLLGGLSLGYGVPKSKLQEIINYCLKIGLLFEEHGIYFSKRLQNHKNFRKNLSEFGKKGAEERKKQGWLKGGLTDPDAKERKGKERKGNKILKGISFSENKEEVFFEDGSSQKLGTDQKALLEMGELKPKDITKGLIN